jgi:hypothetical protein
MIHDRGRHIRSDTNALVRSVTFAIVVAAIIPGCQTGTQVDMATDPASSAAATLAESPSILPSPPGSRPTRPPSPAFDDGQDPAALAVCQPAAAGWDGSVAAAFTTSVGDIRRLLQAQGQPTSDPWPTIADGTDATLCYVDGSIPKSPGPGKPSYDRAVAAVLAGDVYPLTFGYRDEMPIIAP